MTISRARITVALLLTVLAVGCTRDVAGLATGQPKVTGTTSACNFVSAPMMPVPSRADDEPNVFVPQPSGWERESQHEKETIRFAMKRMSSPPGRVAVASVKFRTLPGHIDPATEFQNLRSRAEKHSGTTDLTVADANVCGLPAQTFRYTLAATAELPTRRETLLLVVIPTTGKTHEVNVTLTTNDADSPDYQRAADTILSGFQVLAPTG